MMPGPTNTILDINGRTDTKSKPPFGFLKGICAWCLKEIRYSPFVSLTSGRHFCCEACCVHREVIQ